MVAATESGLRVHRLEVSNFMRVKALTVEADGRSVVFRGKNTSGKTSALQALWVCLKGLSVREIPEPVHQGEDRATLTLDLGEYQVERVIDGKGRTVKLVVTTRDGTEMRRPQELLNGFLASYSLDPVAFIARKPSDQVDDVLAICEVRAPVDAVQEITGERHELRPGESASRYLERLSADEDGAYYVRRREAHRHLDQKRKAMEEARSILDGMGGPLGAGEREQSAALILGEIEALNRRGDERRELVNQAVASRQVLDQARARLKTYRSECDRETAERGEIQAEIVRLQMRLKVKDEKIAELSGRIEKGGEVCRELERDTEADEAAVKAFADPGPQILQLRQRVTDVETANRQGAKRRLAAEQRDRLAVEVEQAEADHEQLGKVLAALRGLRVHLLDGVSLGVDGLEVGLGELRLNGVSFRQASQAQKIRVACAVSMRQRPRLKLLKIDGFEALDQESKSTVFELAAENGFEIFAAEVSEDEQLTVTFVDAEADAA